MSERSCPECGGLLSEFPTGDCTNPHVPEPDKKPRRKFIICGLTMKAFEILEGKVFIEFRGNPPRFPIYVTEEK